MKKIISFALLIVMTIICFTFSSCECKDDEHNYLVSIIKEVTTDDDGIEQYTCSKCGNTYQINVPAKGIKIPELSNTDEDSAKNIISSMGLVPKVSYEYNDNVEFGNVVSVNSDDKLHTGDKVSIVISKGPKFIDSKNANVEWSTKTVKDIKEFYGASIEDGILYIVLKDVQFVNAVAWKDSYDQGEKFVEGFGEATVNNTRIPIKIKSDKPKWKRKDTVKVDIEIPLSELGIQKPTEVEVELCALDSENKQINIELSFNILW